MDAAGTKRQKLTNDILINGSLVLLVILWTIPTLGLLISSFRTPADIQTSGWWMVFPHREWVVVEEIENPNRDFERDQPIEIAGATATFDEFRDGIETEDGRRIQWIGNRRSGKVEVQG